MKRIGVLTSGGDSPGMNAAIRAVVRTALYRGIKVAGILRGYTGLIHDEIINMDHRSVSNIIGHGGTMLKTSRCPEFQTKEGRARAAEVVSKNEIDGLVIIGGNGSYAGADIFMQEHKIPCIGLPGTIDNDLEGTDFTIGSDTALNTALDAVDKIRDTLTSLERIFIVEVMGRSSGYIALNVALAGGAEQVVIPERTFDIQEMCHAITEGYIRGKASWLIIVAEGAIRGQDLAKKIAETTDLDTRLVVLGHIQRGGAPTAKDRILATCLGTAAVELLHKGEGGVAVGLKGNKVNTVPFKEAFETKPIQTQALHALIKILI